MSRHVLVFLGVVLVFSLGCGLLDEEEANVSFDVDIPASFTIDADQLCPENTDCDQSQGEAPADQELPPIEKSVTVDVVEKVGDEKGRKLEQYANSFRKIEIIEVKYEVANNSLNFDLPPTDVYLGPEGAGSIDDDGVTLLAEIPKIPAETNKSGTAEVDQAGRDASSDQLQNLKVNVLANAKPKIEKGEPFPPNGAAQMKITIVVKFTANPADLG